jgi:hypothetical protein
MMYLYEQCKTKPASTNRKNHSALDRHWWLTSVILATPEAEIRRIVVQSQPREIV